MPKKPTESFGYIAFGKDGSVRKHIETLPANKPEQESEIGRRFAAGLAMLTGQSYEAVACREDDHDFWLLSSSRRILVQATEIVARDYVRPLGHQDYIDGRHPFTDFVFEGPNKIFGVDKNAKKNVLANRIKAKIGKHYSKPQIPLWLLVWTVRADYEAFYVKGGQPCVSSSVRKAREYLANNGPDPFDEVWFHQLNYRPHRIWPL